jgi:hypothetical protein
VTYSLHQSASLCIGLHPGLSRTLAWNAIGAVTRHPRDIYIRTMGNLARSSLVAKNNLGDSPGSRCTRYDMWAAIAFRNGSSFFTKVAAGDFWRLAISVPSVCSPSRSFIGFGRRDLFEIVGHRGGYFLLTDKTSKGTAGSMPITRRLVTNFLSVLLV